MKASCRKSLKNDPRKIEAKNAFFKHFTSCKNGEEEKRRKFMATILAAMRALPDPFSRDIPDLDRSDLVKWDRSRGEAADSALGGAVSPLRSRDLGSGVGHLESEEGVREQKVALEILRKEPLYWEICTIIKEIATLAVDNAAVLVQDPGQRDFSAEEGYLFKKVQKWEKSKLLQKPQMRALINHQWRILWKMMNAENYQRYRQWSSLQTREQQERANRNLRTELMFLKIPLQTPEIWTAISSSQRILCTLHHTWVWLNVFVVDLHIISVISSAAQNAFSWYLLTAKSFLGWFGVCCGGATFLVCIPFTAAVIWQFPTISNFAIKTFDQLVTTRANEVKGKMQRVAGNIYDNFYRWVIKPPVKQ
jgi:hypothetical protein